MKNTTEVPNEVIIDAHKEACQKWKTIIEGIAPELFKPMFKVGDWIVGDSLRKQIGKIVDVKKCGYSVDEKGVVSSWGNTVELATPSEIESHLIKEAEKRGFKKGVSCYWNDESNVTHHNLGGDWNYNEESDNLNMGHKIIYMNGKWATIISEPLELTLDEIAKKFGVDAVKIKK